MKAAEVMTRCLITVTPESPILEAVHLMLEHRISGLPVVDTQGDLIGIVTEGDLLRRSETGTERQRRSWRNVLISAGRLADEYVHTHGSKVDEVMSRNPHTVLEDASLEEVVTIMERHRVKRVPVVRGGKLVGIITRANLLETVARVARTMLSFVQDDALIRDRIIEELAKQPWHAIGVGIAVREGKVGLSGAILDERLRAALRVLVENVPGVKEVHDHLVWVEPCSGMAFSSAEDAQAESGISG